MLKLLVIADDFTGALDTGVQFAKNGISTAIEIGGECRFLNASGQAQVVVVDAETRHLTPKEAYRIVFDIAQRAKSFTETIYKKTDSALRGGIGCELAAALDASDECELLFIPAYPRVNRVTNEGVHYVDGVPVSESVFGKDPFEPVLYSVVQDVIKETSDVSVTVVPFGKWDGVEPAPGQKRVLVFDAQTDEDLRDIAQSIKGKAKTTLLAGCAGFALTLPDMLGLEHAESSKPRQTDGMFLISGSLNPITKRQLDYAQKMGFLRIGLTPEQKLMPGYLDTEEGTAFLAKLKEACRQRTPVILDTFGEGGVEKTDIYAQSLGIATERIREHIADRMGEFAARWLEFGLDYTLVMTGGDTLTGMMSHVGATGLRVISEIAQGTVVSELSLADKKIQIISKSGGFGPESVFYDIAKELVK